MEKTSFGWVIHDGDDYSSDACMFAREVDDYKQLYSLDVLGVEDRGECRCCPSFERTLLDRKTVHTKLAYLGPQEASWQLQMDSKAEHVYTMLAKS